MPPLSTQLRNSLEATVKQARRTAEAAAKVAIERLTVSNPEPGSHLTVDERQLRNRLRAHGRQLGDGRDATTGTQAITRLIHECAYEHWHRMLFARFLAENNLLIHEKEGMPVTLAECDELAKDEVGQASRLPVLGASSPPGEARQDASQLADRRSATQMDGWTLAARYASRMLPQIFRPDDPVLQVGFAPEHKRALEKLVNELPVEVFTADDSLGWVYQLWQADRKDEVNKSGEKITGETLPAVTQLFTEHYMVLFLLHNTIGAWWAARVNLEGRIEKSEWDRCQTEDDCRKLVALPGYEFTYLRFIRDEPPKEENSRKEAQKAQKGEEKDFFASSAPCCGQSSSGAWRPAAGAFPGWPKSLKDFKLLDPCCGSGHFLVAAFTLLVMMRMQDEKLSAKDACDAVLRDNLHGLELDARCTQIAAFALALTAWKFPNLPAPQEAQAGRDCRKEAQNAQKGEEKVFFASSAFSRGQSLGFRQLPTLNIACSGLGVNARKEDWLALANDDTRLRSGLEQLYDLFQKAPELGSLINPRQVAQGDLVTAGFAEIQPLLTKALQSERAKLNDDLSEIGVTARGMAQAADLLAADYHFVVTNVPYLGTKKQTDLLRNYCETNHANAKTDLATCFVERCLDSCAACGSVALITPQNWLFLGTYMRLRVRLLSDMKWDFVTKLGPRAFETISGEVVNVTIVGITRQRTSDNHALAAIDVSECGTPSEKSAQLISRNVGLIPQRNQAMNPDARIVLDSISGTQLLREYASDNQGLSTGDNPRFRRVFWEVSVFGQAWEPEQSSVETQTPYGGRSGILLWEDGRGQL